jgi:hypothetical protein
LTPLAAIACDVRYLEVRRLISPAIAKGNAMIDLPFVGEERLAAEGTYSTLCLMDLLDHSRQPRPSLRWGNLPQDDTAFDNCAPEHLPVLPFEHTRFAIQPIEPGAHARVATSV